MNIADIVIVLVVAVIVVVAAVRFAGSATGKRDCCSGKAKNPSGSAGKKFADAEVTDRDESHYPYRADLTIGGMTCEHCVKNVTNALESIDGAWAQVELAGGRARLLAKSLVGEDAAREVVEEAGYRLVSFKPRN